MGACVEFYGQRVIKWQMKSKDMTKGTILLKKGYKMTNEQKICQKGQFYEKGL